jgi:hypothetical protein
LVRIPPNKVGKGSSYSLAGGFRDERILGEEPGALDRLARDHRILHRIVARNEIVDEISRGQKGSRATRLGARLCS